MRLKARLYLTVAAIGIASLLAAAPAQVSAQTAVAIDNDDIGGVVTGANGPEAGVWVVAETTDLPTRYAKMVVNDDQGRYVVPGQQLTLRAVAAPNEAAAAQYYPAIYWYAMLKIPSASEFGRKDGEIPEKIKQTDWLNLMKNNGCIGCHQMGQLSTRTFPKGLGEFSTHAEAWMRRTQAGQSGGQMVNILAG